MRSFQFLPKPKKAQTLVYEMGKAAVTVLVERIEALVQDEHYCADHFRALVIGTLWGLVQDAVEAVPDEYQEFVEHVRVDTIDRIRKENRRLLKRLKRKEKGRRKNGEAPAAESQPS